MTTTESTWQGHAARLAEQLVESGDIQDPVWARAIAETPRHLLVPVSYRQQPDGSWSCRADDLDLAYSATTLVTTVEAGLPVSSSTKPDLMARMLETLDVHDGHRVLEIGTGTGYNAALLTHRLGENQVYSLDVDSELVESARGRLASFGSHPHLMTRDGEEGWPDAAPFDRIIATCSVERIPWTWAEQLTLGGLALVDLKLGSGAGNLVLLRRYPDRLEGHFVGRWAAFMTMRHPARSRTPRPRRPRLALTQEWITSAPPEPWNTHREAWMLATVTQTAELQRGYLLDPQTKRPTATTLSASDGSWCEVDLVSRHVRAGGGLKLWEKVEAGYYAWQERGEPTWPQFGLTVTPDQHSLWLERPSTRITELPKLT